MAPRDHTKWVPVEGDHADDPTYIRVPDTEVSYEVDVEDEINATAGAISAAEELGVDLASVTGTGANGRITKSDVEAAAE